MSFCSAVKELTNEKITDRASEITEFPQNELKDFEPSYDYKQFLEYAIMFIRGIDQRSVPFRAAVRVAWNSMNAESRILAQDLFI